MCYSAESSLTAWLLANAAALLLFCRNQNFDRWNAAFIAVFSSVQLLEAGLWLGLANSLLTQLVLLVLFLLPLVQSYMGARLTGSALLGYLAMLYVVLFVFTLAARVLPAAPGQFRSCVGPNGHLVWQDDARPLFFTGDAGMYALLGVGLGVPLLFAKWRGLPLLLVGAATYASAAARSTTGEFGSLWCYYAVLYALVALLV